MSNLDAYFDKNKYERADWLFVNAFVKEGVKVKKFCYFMLGFCAVASAETAWFEGPVFAVRGTSLQRKQIRFDAKVGYEYQKGFYWGDYFISFDEMGVKSFHLVEPSLEFGVGIARNLDLNLFLPVMAKSFAGNRSVRLGDIQARLGYQFAKDRGGLYPDMRLVFVERFPSGQYQHLNPGKSLTDASGLGLYVSSLILSIQKTFRTFGRQPTRITLNLGGGISSKGNFKGESIYSFEGAYIKVSQGRMQTYGASANFAVEQAIGKNWAISLDLSASWSYLDIKSDSSGWYFTKISFRTPGNQVVTLAPQVQYNVSEKLGFSLGSWFSLAGRDSKVRRVEFRVTYLTP